jgi:hypothetical protein
MQIVEGCGEDAQMAHPVLGFCVCIRLFFVSSGSLWQQSAEQEQKQQRSPFFSLLIVYKLDTGPAKFSIYS